MIQLRIHPGQRPARSRSTANVRILFQCLFDLHLAFIRQQGAGAIDQPSTGFQQGPGMGQHLRLQFNQPTEFRAVLGKGQVRVAPNGSGGRTGCVQQDRVILALMLQRVTSDDVALVRPVRLRFSRTRSSRGLRNIQSRHLGPGCRHLQRLAARCSTQIQHGFPGLWRQHTAPATPPPRPAPTSRPVSNPGRCRDLPRILHTHRPGRQCLTRSHWPPALQ